MAAGMITTTTTKGSIAGVRSIKSNVWHYRMCSVATNQDNNINISADDELDIYRNMVLYSQRKA
jgi:hypothetical protein